MRYFVDVLPGVPAPSGAPYIDVSPLFPDAIESDAYEHWLFGTDSGSLSGRKGNSSFSPVGSSPTYDSSSLIIPSGQNGLKSTIVEPTALTVCVVVKIETPVLGRVLCGTSQQSAAGGGDNTGHMLTMGTSTAIQVVARPLGSNLTVTASTDALQDKWVFMAVGVDYLNNNRRGYMHGVAEAGGTPGTTPLNKSSRELAIGNAYYNNGTGTNSYRDGATVAEAIVFNKFLSVAEIRDVAARSVSRMALRGITLYEGT